MKPSTVITSLKLYPEKNVLQNYWSISRSLSSDVLQDSTLFSMLFNIFMKVLLNLQYANNIKMYCFLSWKQQFISWLVFKINDVPTRCRCYQSVENPASISGTSHTCTVFGARTANVSGIVNLILISYVLAPLWINYPKPWHLNI